MPPGGVAVVTQGWAVLNRAGGTSALYLPKQLELYRAREGGKSERCDTGLKECAPYDEALRLGRALRGTRAGAVATSVK